MPCSLEMDATPALLLNAWPALIYMHWSTQYVSLVPLSTDQNAYNVMEPNV